MAAPPGGDAELVSRVRRAVHAATGAWPLACEPMAAELSLRRFFRVRCAGAPGTLVARVEQPEDPSGRPPGIPPEPPLEPLRTVLEEHGLPVPRRYGGDAGVDLLEDLGDRSLRAAVADATPAERRALAERAGDRVPRIQRVADDGPLAPTHARRRGDAHIDYKAELFAAWSLRRGGREASPAERACARDAFALVARTAAAAPQRLAHRDFQSANLLLARRPRELVMIDLQGALLAPPEYDLASLLRDSYVDLGDDEVAHHLERVRPLLPDAPDPETAAARFDLLTLARKAKDHARFLYAAHTRDDRRYLAFAPRTLRVLRDACARAAQRDPRLAAFADLVASLPEVPCAP